jgi:hypothetical protein
MEVNNLGLAINMTKSIYFIAVFYYNTNNLPSSQTFECLYTF